MSSSPAMEDFKGAVWRSDDPQRIPVQGKIALAHNSGQRCWGYFGEPGPPWPPLLVPSLGWHLSIDGDGTLAIRINEKDYGANRLSFDGEILDQR